MKVWIKTLIALTLALIVGLFVPLSWEWIVNIFQTLSTLSINIGRYILFPLLFFSVSIRAFELHRQRKLGKAIGLNWIMMSVSAFLFSIIGTLTAFILPRPLDLPQQTERIIEIPSIQEIIQNIFPENLFNIFTADANFIIPLLVFAIFLGWNFHYDKITTRPIAELFDAFSKTFFHMNLFFVEISGFGIFFIFTNAIFQIKSNKSIINLYAQLFLLLLVITCTLIFVIYPILLRLLAKEQNPYKSLFGMITPAISALVSGDLFFSIPLSLYHNEKNLGIQHPVNVTSTAMTLIAGRAGTALVTSATAIFLRKHYVNIIEVYEVFTIIGLSFILSFFLGSFHRSSILAMIIVIFTVLNTKENEYINLVAIAPFLYCVAAFLDSVNNIVITQITGHLVQRNKKVNLRMFS